MDGVAQGEALMKATYEAIRNSPHWNTSLLIVTWDEHGGFYDHVAPQAAVPPGDTPIGDKYNRYHFAFDRYGVRVPGIIVSPLIPANLIDHRPYDHSSIPATIEKLFGLASLTERDKAANHLIPLLSLATPRTDAPIRLPNPANPVAPQMAQLGPSPHSTVDKGNLPGSYTSPCAMTSSFRPPKRSTTFWLASRLSKRGQAAQYIAEVQGKIQAA